MEDERVATINTRTSRELIARTAATARAVSVPNQSNASDSPTGEIQLPGVIARPPRDETAPPSTQRPLVSPSPTFVALESPTTTLRLVTPIPPVSTVPTGGPIASPGRLSPVNTPASGSTATVTPIIRKNRVISYVAIGASDTVGVGTPNPEKDGWVSRVHQRLAPGSRLLNLGISGARLSDLLTQQLTKAIVAKPDLVTVWSVVNDLNANVDISAYERDLQKLLGELTTKTGAKIVVGNAPDLALIPAYAKLGIPAHALRVETSRWNATVARVVARYPGRAFLVDLYSRSADIEIDPALVAGDDFHPSIKGYAKLADVFWEFMAANHLVEF